MNILYIGHEQDLNGSSRSLLNIISSLEKENHNIHVLTSYSDGPFYEALKNHNVTILVKPYYRWCVRKYDRKQFLRLKLKWRLYESRVNEKTAKELALYVKEHNIQIIHMNTSVINIGALIKKYINVKVIWHIREFADLDFEMYPLISPRKYYAFMNKYTDRFICVSKAVANHYSQLGNSPLQKLVIYNGVGRENLIEKRPQTDNGIVTLLLTGRLEAAKGQTDAIRACELLYNRGIQNFKLLLAGSGTLDCTIPAELQDKIVLLGNIKDMPSLRKTVDIELVCSKAEAFGRVTVEAMLAGIPVIGSNTGATPELIAEGVTGYLYEKGNIEQLALRMEQLITNPQLREQMGSNGKTIAEKQYLIESCVSNILKVYHSMLHEITPSQLLES